LTSLLLRLGFILIVSLSKQCHSSASSLRLLGSAASGCHWSVTLHLVRPQVVEAVLSPAIP
jgi:hypothetical protein